MENPITKAIKNKKNAIQITIAMKPEDDNLAPEAEGENEEAEEIAEHEGQEPEEEAQMHDEGYLKQALAMKQNENKRLSPEDVFGEMSESDKALPARGLRAKVMRNK